jgi:hypothetical protein
MSDVEKTLGEICRAAWITGPKDTKAAFEAAADAVASYVRETMSRDPEGYVKMSALIERIMEKAEYGVLVTKLEKEIASRDAKIAKLEHRLKTTTMFLWEATRYLDGVTDIPFGGKRNFPLYDPNYESFNEEVKELTKLVAQRNKTDE